MRIITQRKCSLVRKGISLFHMVLCTLHSAVSTLIGIGQPAVVKCRCLALHRRNKVINQTVVQSIKGLEVMVPTEVTVQVFCGFQVHFSS